MRQQLDGQCTITTAEIENPLTGAWLLRERLEAQSTLSRFDARRDRVAAVYDARGNFVGTFDPRLDSRRDVNYTDAAIEVHLDRTGFRVRAQAGVFISGPAIDWLPDAI